MRRPGIAIATFAALLAAACGSFREMKQDLKTEVKKHGKLDGLEVKVFEVAGQDGKYTIPVRRETGVWDSDRSSILVVNLKDLNEPSPEAPFSLQRRAENCAKMYRALAERAEKIFGAVSALNAVDPETIDGQGVEKLQQRVDEAGLAVSQIISKVHDIYGSRATGILRGEFADAPVPGIADLRNLSAWLRGEPARLVSESRVTYGVRAFHYAPGKSRVRIHVENWDDLDAGKLAERAEGVVPEDVRAQLKKIQQAKDEISDAKSKELPRPKEEGTPAEPKEPVAPDEPGAPVAPVAPAAPAAAAEASGSEEGKAALTTLQSDASVLRVRVGKEAIEKAAEGGTEVLRGRGDLLPGEIDLSKIPGLAVGHRIEVHVVALKPGEKDPDKAASRQDFLSYDVEAIDAGWRWEPRPSLVFLRAGSRGKGADATEDRQQWKPTPAAILTLNHRFREPGGFFERSLNFLDPGFGVHLTAPDMEKEAAEFGIGPAVSLFDGLLVGGVGWNLTSSDRRTYYFVGVDLWELFNQTKKLGGGAGEGSGD